MAATAEQSDYERLISAGMEAEDVCRIAQAAAHVYDGNRKPKGAQSGALGMTGCHVYKHLADEAINFSAFHPFTAEDLATNVVMSRGAVGRAINRLIEHGFIEKRRVGRGFEFRLLILAQALIETHEDYCSYEPGCSGYEFERPIEAGAGHSRDRVGKGDLVMRPQIPKRMAARIRGAQERVRQKRLSIVGAEYNYAQSTKRVGEFEADPEGFASRNYGRNGVDSYPVQTTISRERERIDYHERRRDERICELAELESELLRTEAQVLVEVMQMRPTPRRVPWPRRLPAFTKFREQFEEEMRREDERWRIQRANDDAEFERMIAEEEEALEEARERGDEEHRRSLAGMTPAEYANYRAWADYFVEGLRSGSLTMSDILAQLSTKRGA